MSKSVTPHASNYNPIPALPWQKRGARAKKSHWINMTRTPNYTTEQNKQQERFKHCF